ncbi:hypothetical protein PMAYCL1PPCAC_28948, partial [Pristionchus mayeri]
PIFSLLLLPLVFSLQCYTFQSPAGMNLTNVQKTTVECPITARFCISSHQRTVDGSGNQMLTETRGCADSQMCKPFIKSQCTGCLWEGRERFCCCMGDRCNEKME